MTVRISRRGFFRVSLGSGLALGLGVTAVRAEEGAGNLASPELAAAQAESTLARALRPGVSRVIELANTHTAETLRVAYRCATGLVPDALSRLQWLLRDHRANESAPIDPLLFDQLAALAADAGVAPRYQIISGYRSPLTNLRLAAGGHGVATRSLHMVGKAIDVRLEVVGCDALRDLAMAAAEGGVGYYAKSDFVHLDTGRVRTWAG